MSLTQPFCTMPSSLPYADGMTIRTMIYRSIPLTNPSSTALQRTFEMSYCILYHAERPPGRSALRDSYPHRIGTYHSLLNEALCKQTTVMTDRRNRTMIDGPLPIHITMVSCVNLHDLDVIKVDLWEAVATANYYHLVKKSCSRG